MRKYYAPVFDGDPITIEFLYYYILNNNNSDCFTKFYLQYEKDRTLNVYKYENHKQGAKIIGNECKKLILKNLLQCIKKRKLLCITISIKSTNKNGGTIGHFNVLIFNPFINEKKLHIERYEPHGHVTKMNNVHTNDLDSKLRDFLDGILNNSSYKYEYKSPKHTCPKLDNEYVDFQSHETKLEKIPIENDDYYNKDDPFSFASIMKIGSDIYDVEPRPGYCVAWGFMMMDIRLKNKTKNARELFSDFYKKNKDNLTDKLISFIKRANNYFFKTFLENNEDAIDTFLQFHKSLHYVTESFVNDEKENFQQFEKHFKEKIQFLQNKMHDSLYQKKNKKPDRLNLLINDKDLGIGNFALGKRKKKHEIRVTPKTITNKCKNSDEAVLQRRGANGKWYYLTKTQKELMSNKLEFQKNKKCKELNSLKTFSIIILNTIKNTPTSIIDKSGINKTTIKYMKLTSKYDNIKFQLNKNVTNFHVYNTISIVENFIKYLKEYPNYRRNNVNSFMERFVSHMKNSKQPIQNPDAKDISDILNKKYDNVKMCKNQISFKKNMNIFDNWLAYKQIQQDLIYNYKNKTNYDFLIYVVKYEGVPFLDDGFSVMIVSTLRNSNQFQMKKQFAKSSELLQS